MTREELDDLIKTQLTGCSPEQRSFFENCAVVPYLVPIYRRGRAESVFVLAKANGVVLYYEDVEEGFNISPLSHDGSIASPGYEQWELGHALEHLVAA
jgi:hypothetical protein